MVEDPDSDHFDGDPDPSFSVLRIRDPRYGIRDPGSGIRDPGSGKNLLRILDPGVKKAPDPESRIPDPKLIFLRA
jgi:hypothetical protein